MKKLLAIIVLGLFLASCTQQNRNDEYICKFISGTPHEDVTLEIYKDKVKMQYVSGANYTYQIIEEKSDRIIFGYTNLGENQAKSTFYKKTKKFKWESSYKKTKNFFTVIWACEKLN
tara:strand:- start:202 stop:552 length:351 start_codon:yes stop_codon:yes gene_type:complete